MSRLSGVLNVYTGSCVTWGGGASWCKLNLPRFFAPRQTGAPKTALRSLWPNRAPPGPPHPDVAPGREPLPGPRKVGKRAVWGKGVDLVGPAPLQKQSTASQPRRATYP